MYKAIGEFKTLTSDRCIWNKRLPGYNGLLHLGRSLAFKVFSDQLVLFLSILFQTSKANSGFCVLEEPCKFSMFWKLLLTIKLQSRIYSFFPTCHLFAF